MPRIQQHCTIMHFSLTRKEDYHNLLFDGKEGGLSTTFEVEALAPVSHNFQDSITDEHCSCLPQAVITFLDGLGCISFKRSYFPYKFGNV